MTEYVRELSIPVRLADAEPTSNSRVTAAIMAGLIKVRASQAGGTGPVRVSSDAGTGIRVYRIELTG